MRIWSFIQQKGGVGKTTLCLNLAVAAEAKGEKVLVVDLDQQGSAVFWSTTRGTNKPTVIDALPEKLPDIIRAAPELGITLVPVDINRPTTSNPRLPISKKRGRGPHRDRWRPHLYRR